jgi:hypothetical protein
MAEVEPQMTNAILRIRVKGLARHEGNIAFCQRHFQQLARILRLLQCQPEEQPALGHLPVSQVGKVLFQRSLHGIAAYAVGIAQGLQMGREVRAGQLLGDEPLTGAIAVQVGRLLELDQMRVELGRGNQITFAQARCQRLGEGTGINPRRVLQMADQRGRCFAIVGQRAVRIILVNRQAMAVDHLGQRAAVFLAVTGTGRVLEAGNQIGQPWLGRTQGLIQLLGDSWPFSCATAVILAPNSLNDCKAAR